MASFSSQLNTLANIAFDTDLKLAQTFLEEDIDVKPLLHVETTLVDDQSLTFDHNERKPRRDLGSVHSHTRGSQNFALSSIIWRQQATTITLASVRMVDLESEQGLEMHKIFQMLSTLLRRVKHLEDCVYSVNYRSSRFSLVKSQQSGALRQRNTNWNQMCQSPEEMKVMEKDTSLGSGVDEHKHHKSSASEAGEGIEFSEKLKSTTVSILRLRKPVAVPKQVPSMLKASRAVVLANLQLILVSAWWCLFLKPLGEPISL